jgi:hypothetical protein
MPMQLSHDNQNILIPRGSRVTAMVMGTSQRVVVIGTVSQGGAEMLRVQHPIGWNTPWPVPLTNAGTFVMRLDIRFLEAANVRTSIIVTNLLGTVHGMEWTLDIAADPGDVHTLSYGLGVV